MLQWFRKPDIQPAGSSNEGDLHIALTRKLIHYLTNQMASPKKATAIQSQIARFKELPPAFQERELPSLYLKIEQHLVDEDALPKFTREQLRKSIRNRFEPLMDLENFSIVFESPPKQSLLLSQYLLKNLILRAAELLAEERKEMLACLTEWIFHIPNVHHLKLPFNLQKELPETQNDWIPFLAKFSRHLYHFLAKALGPQEAASLFAKSYQEIAEIYRPLDTFYVIIQLLPEQLLDENKIALLNEEEVRKVLLSKVEYFRKVTQSLAHKSEELRETRNEVIVAQNTALESVRLLQSVLAAANEGVISADAAGKIILVNDQALNIFGYKEEELIGEAIELLMPEKYRQQHRQGMERFLNHQESRAIGQRLVLEGLKKDGTVFPLALRITHTQVADQMFFTAAMRDMSEDLRQESHLKKLSHDVRQWEQRYHRLLETMPDTIFTLSLDGIFLSLNPAFATVSGWSQEEWIGKPFTRLIHPDDSVKALRMFQTVLQGIPLTNQELRLRLRSGEFIFGEFSVSPNFHNGKITGVLGVFRDISRYKHLEEQLNTLTPELRESRESVEALRRQLHSRNQAAGSAAEAQQQKRYHSTQAQLQQLRKKVRQLSELIPLCPSCHKIRDDQKFWSAVKDFAADPANQKHMNSICPECKITLSLEASPGMQNGRK